MRLNLIQFACVLGLLCSSSPAYAWWEATLQQIDVTVVLSSNGGSRVLYDLRYHVDRGRFQGLNINNSGRTLEWDRFSSFIEDSRGRRYPVRIRRRGRDGAYMVRLARGEGLRRGWVTVHLEATEDLRDCCYSTNENQQIRLDWRAFSWNVGMDRINVTFRLESDDRPLEADPATTEHFNVGQTPDGLVIEKIRPVRWYQMTVGIFLPDDWLDFRPRRAVQDDASLRPTEDQESEAPIPLHHEAGPVGNDPFGTLWFALIGFAALLLLSIKFWMTSTGYTGRPKPAQPMLVPHVPPLLRWAVIGVLLLSGAWLQSLSFLAAGTLAFSFGVLLSLRGIGTMSESETSQGQWSKADFSTLGELANQKGLGKQRFATLLDGSTWIGAPIALICFASVFALVSFLFYETDSFVTDGLAIDLTLTFVAIFLTARRSDLPPVGLECSAILLKKVSKKLSKKTDGLEIEKELLIRGSEDQPDNLRLALASPSAKIPSITIETQPIRKLGGWSLGLRATVESKSGKTKTIEGSSAGKIVRSLSPLFRNRKK